MIWNPNCEPATLICSLQSGLQQLADRSGYLNFSAWFMENVLSLILPRSRTGTVWFYTSTNNKRAARPKLYTKSLTRDLKLMYSRFTLVRIFINLNSSQLNMFREIILAIFRSTRLCVTACGVMHTPHYTTSCNTQSSAPEDG